jgi:hypothetical protein
MVSAWLLAGCSSPKKIDVGGTCILNSDCNSPLLCTDGKCHDACHASVDCPPGETCVKTNDTSICQLPAEADCSRTPCGGTYVCASDLRCRTVCQSAVDCAGGQVCVTSVCADPDELVTGTDHLPQKGPSLAADGGTDAQATATGGTGGVNSLGGTGGFSGGAGDAAAGGSGGGGGPGGAGGASGGVGDAAAAGSGGTKDAASGLGGAGGTATSDAGSPDVRPADAAIPPDAKALTPDAAAVISGDGGASTVLTGCGKVTTKRYFCDDFESGLDNWHYATEGWGLTTTTFQSANYSVTDSPNGNYPAGDKSDITMVKSVDLTAAVSPIVTFWHLLSVGNSFECCNYTYPDYAYVDVSSDGGNTWTILTSFTDANNTSVWSFQQFSLASYAGKKIKLRFRLVDNTISPTADGWYIDDVEIREAVQQSVPDAGSQNVVTAEPTGCDGAPAAGRYFCEDFETATDLNTYWLVATNGWNTVDSTYQSFNHSVTDSPSGNYPAGAKSDMTMLNSVDLTTAVWPIATFWHKLNLGSVDGTCNLNWGTDSTYVDASSDGGTTWTVMTSFNCTNNTTVWNFHQLSLASYAGQQIKLRFRLNGTNGGADGWYVDDIKIRENEFVPVASDLALCTTQATGGACNGADLCGEQCGPDLLGSKSLTCPAGTFVEGACTFPSGADYSCYKVGAAQACATGTEAGQACTATACQACGATTGTGYLDASGAAKQGFCVCSKGTWSCGTTAEWPCYPATAGATVPASCN